MPLDESSSRIQRTCELPVRLRARGYHPNGHVYNEALLKRFQAPGVEEEAVELYRAAGVRVVVVLMENGDEWSAPVEKLHHADAFVLRGRKLRALSRSEWTVRILPAPSLF